MLFNKRMTQQRIDLSHVVCNWSSWEGKARSDSAVTEFMTDSKVHTLSACLASSVFNRKTLNMTPASECRDGHSEQSEAKKVEADEAA